MFGQHASSLDDLAGLASWAGTSKNSWWGIVLILYHAATWMWVRNEREQLWELMVDALRYHRSNEEVFRAGVWRPPVPCELGRCCLAHRLATSQGVARGALAATASQWTPNEAAGCLETAIRQVHEALLPFLRE